MKLHLFLASSLLAASVVSAFQVPQSGAAVRRLDTTALHVGGTMMGNVVDISERAQRDVYSLQQWAQNYGAQMAPGVEITTQDNFDFSLMTNQNIAAGSPVIFVPSQIILSSDAVEREFGGNLMWFFTT